MIDGTRARRFAAVRATFADIFARRDEIGCVTVAGRTVVYLWAGTPATAARGGPARW
ncbi:hypothetical protein ABZ801_04665 [Actinomadura sp. NPDC047616]|uniref:hypothetical protein n=1 Tax=Actinomadura sp. NPDC047616 TaxID=3155914 RepID=UPI0033D52D2F